MTSTASPNSITVSLAPRTWGTTEPWHEVTVQVRYERGEAGLDRYYVRRADNGQSLGWVCKDRRSGTWTGYVCNSAYYAADADIMTTSERHPAFPGTQWFQGHVVLTEARTRQEATNEIVWVLARTQAEALDDIVQGVRQASLPWTDKVKDVQITSLVG